MYNLKEITASSTLATSECVRGTSDTDIIQGSSHPEFLPTCGNKSKTERYLSEDWLRKDRFIDIPDSILDVPPILLIYTDDGPDHRSTYMSVKLSMIALFIELDLDELVALQTAPSNSWANPVECIMSIVNIGLQGIGIMRKKGTKANNMKEVRAKLATDNLKQEWHDSVETPTDMLNCQMKRLSLKDRQFNTFSAAEDANIDELWKNCLRIEGELHRYHLTAKDVKKFDKLSKFLSHCCIEGHYCFQVKKCGLANCTICRSLHDERTRLVGTLLFPVLDDDDHYKPFANVYKTETHDKKLTQHQRKQLAEVLEDVEYTCGFQFDDVIMPTGFQVCVKDHDCNDHIEKLYYSCGYEACCIHCGEYVHGIEDDHFCMPGEPIPKRGAL
ncbi:Hypothetical predicted protein [Paramuricea clavata]|uniref:Uncharacterized protein n=1 Tax=Paramuricea clavata TaxID=317549 RepID=A0A6S7GCY6_PARCT|nr:Hypothetical predicted protein [Paramuricea clavata]